MNMRMIAVIGVSIGLFSFAAVVAADQPDFRQAVPNIKLPVPYHKDVRDYLGLSLEKGEFTISQMNADIVILVIFDRFCPVSQEYAPMINKVYQKVQGKSELKNRIKFIGIGIKNDDEDVSTFKERYAIPYPIFDDRNATVFNALPGIQTPICFAIKKAAGGSGIEIFYTRQGGFNDEQLFLDTVTSKSGLKF